MTKNEKKDELKNRISMALEDLILQQGFEIICRELADLQKEVIALRRDKEDLIFVRNAKADHIIELKDQVADIKANCDLAIEGRDIKIKELEEKNTELEKESNRLFLEGAKRVEELEKENAELKAKNKWYSEQVCNKECAEVWGNLTKAIELLKWALHSDPEHDNLADFDTKWKQAEQFIKEIGN